MQQYDSIRFEEGMTVGELRQQLQSLPDWAILGQPKPSTETTFRIKLTPVKPD